jgi:outer membrane protein TolC
MKICGKYGLRRVLAAALLLSGAGCAALPEDGGFGGVEARLEGDTALWRRDEAASARIEEAVAALLAEPVTPDSAATVALLNNPDIQAGYAGLGPALAEIAAALPQPPLLGARLDFSGDVGLSLAQDLMGLLSAPARRREAEAGLEAAQARAAARALETAMEARIAAIRYGAARQRAVLAARGADSLEAAATTMDALRDAGNAPEIEAARHRLAAGEGALELRAAEAAETEARLELARLMGVDAAGDWQAAGPDADPPEEEDEAPEIEAARAASLELAALAAERRAAESRRGRAGAAALEGAEAGAEADREDGDWDGGPAVTVPLPLPGRTRAESLRTEAELLRLDEAERAENLNLTTALARETGRREAARARLAELDDTLLPLERQVMAENMRFYNAMQIGPFELLEERRRQLMLEGARLDALEDYWIAAARLDLLRRGGGIGRDEE